MDDQDLEVVFDKSLAEPKWFALQVLSNQENKVETALQAVIREKSLGDVIQKILVPSEKIISVKDGKKYIRVRKFYPGYVFIRMRMYNKAGEFLHNAFSSVRNAKGVVKFIGDGRDPVPLKPSEISDILEKVAAVSGKSVPRISFEIGDVVKIKDGPFLNLTGTVEEIDTELGRLRVNVSMFGRSTPVELEFWQAARFVDEEN